MNLNTVSGFVNGSKRNQIPSQTLASATETAFTVVTDSGTSVAAIIGPSAGGGIAGSESNLNPDANAALLQQNSSIALPRGLSRPEFNNKSFDGRPFLIRMYGTGTAAANAGNTLTLRLYSGTSTAVIGTAGNILAVTSAVATATASSLNFMLEAQLLWDIGTQALQGWFTYAVNFNGTETFATTAALSHNTAVTSLANCKFFATYQWGNAVGGTLQLNELTLERV